MSLLTLFRREKKHQPSDFSAPEGREPEKKGLEKKFAIGERFPWKGIWFEVIGLDFDKMIMKPISMTFKKAKQIKEARNG